MALAITSIDGKPASQAIHDLLKRVADKLNSQAGKQIQITMSSMVKRHFQLKYPGSQHYSPRKVIDGPAASTIAVVLVDVPGVTRAYHDIDIKPKRASKLKIPLHRSAFGIEASNEQLMFIKNKAGNEFLARIEENGALVFMYVLKDHVHQQQDPSLMPSDDAMAKNACDRLAVWLSSQPV